MSALPNDSWNDGLIEQLVQFDEALRLGRPPARKLPLDPQLAEAQDFLRLLQAVWPRSALKIGPYTLLNSLGQGTVGPCYLVEDPRLGQLCVLKILWPDLSAHAQTRAQFIDDAKGAQRLCHAGMAAVKDVRDDVPLCIVVSEFCPGSSLAQWRRKTPQPLAWDIASALIVQLADILEAAHCQGISHGNLKPSNIFMAHETEITPGNLHLAKVRIADFALAKAVQQTRLPSQAGLSWPMPQYLAPEQIQQRSRPPAPASDLYALGVMWYDLLTGRCPVQGTTKDEILVQAVEAMPPPPRQYRPDMPAEVETLVLQCLHKRPHDRPASARGLADSVRALLPAAGRQPSAWWIRWLQRVLPARRVSRAE